HSLVPNTCKTLTIHDITLTTVLTNPTPPQPKHYLMHDVKNKILRFSKLYKYFLIGLTIEFGMLGVILSSRILHKQKQSLIRQISGISGKTHYQSYLVQLLNVVTDSNQYFNSINILLRLFYLTTNLHIRLHKVVNP